MTSGVVPESALDTLLIYAYAQKGVEKVEIEVHRDDANEGKNPSVTYKIRLDHLSQLKWQMVEKAREIKSRLLQKSALLALSHVGAPLDIKDAIIYYAKEYLPPNYSVEVDILG